MVCAISVAVVIYFYILGRISQSQSARQLTTDLLAQCPSTPCVCTEYADDDEHFVPPIVIADSSIPNTVSFIKQIVINMGGEITFEQENYLSAIFKSSVFGFVDDFEVRVDRRDGLIHLRSASRVGRSDLGANKKRIEQFKQAMAATMKE